MSFQFLMLCCGRRHRLAQTDHGEGAEEVFPELWEGEGQVGGGRCLCLPGGQESKKQKRLVFRVEILFWVRHNSAFPLLPTLAWEIFKGGGPSSHCIPTVCQAWCLMYRYSIDLRYQLRDGRKQNGVVKIKDFRVSPLGFKF